MTDPVFPARLLDWSGHRAGGVRKLFHGDHNRPSGGLLRTSLIDRLENWMAALAAGDRSAPRIVLLVGGPGNGKTEAVEASVTSLDKAAGLSGDLLAAFSRQFAAGTGRPVPRLASVQLAPLSSGRLSFELAIVQDATAEDANKPGIPASQLLLTELEKFAFDGGDFVYLACVNRGVLDDAFSIATDSNCEDLRKLLTQVIRAVGVTTDAPSCWPLENYPSIAIWPMDVESLLLATKQNDLAPARQLLEIAINAEKWPKFGTCAAGEMCPHCNSRQSLDDDKRSVSLLKLLRWYELASGKRWNFRDLGSLISFLLAGVQVSESEIARGPCETSAALLKLAADGGTSPRTGLALFQLVASLYQHTLFGYWSRIPARRLRKDIREIGLEKDPTLAGLFQFLNSQRQRSVPSTLERQLLNICELMDPALADPDLSVQISSRTIIKLREIDARFSQSVSEGLSFIARYRVLAQVEIELLKKLAKLDSDLAESTLRSKKPAVASRLQATLREFACRLVRRSIGVQTGTAYNSEILDQYSRVIDDDDEQLHIVVKQVEGLLNDKDHFRITLNTTFGEPSPPDSRQAVLTTQKQKVRPQKHGLEGRPKPTLRFLSVGNSGTHQTVPLTFELYKSVSELGRGLLPSALPRTVIALLDTTRARLSGQIVRDEELLEGAEIRIGRRNEVIVRELGRFVVRKERIS